MNKIIDEYKNPDQVQAIAIGGSSSAKTSDKTSDLDIYVFVNEDIPSKIRGKLLKNTLQITKSAENISDQVMSIL